jgi:hypothetical protein
MHSLPELMTDARMRIMLNRVFGADFDEPVQASEIRHFDVGLPASSNVLEEYPTLRDRFTPRDHLLPLGDGVDLNHAWVTFERNEILVHPGLKRFLRSGTNVELLALLRAASREGTAVSIAVDHWGLHPTGTCSQAYELDTWFGAPYKAALLDNPTASGKTLLCRMLDLGHYERAGLRLEIYWSTDDNIKTLVIEELPDLPTVEKGNATSVACRFVHLQRDLRRKATIHLDGAIAIYSFDKYRRRHESSVNGCVDQVWADRKIKLFRLDEQRGGHHKMAWLDIITSFFKGNELVLEYFYDQPFRDIYRQKYGRAHPWIAKAERENSHQY